MATPDTWTLWITGLMLAIALLVVLCGGVLLKLVVRMLEGFSPPFLRSLRVVFLATLVAMVAHSALSLVVAQSFAPTDGQEFLQVDGLALMWIAVGSLGVSALVALFTNAWFLDRMLRHPDGRRVGYARACLASLLTLLGACGLGFLLTMVLVVVLALSGLDPALMQD